MRTRHIASTLILVSISLLFISLGGCGDETSLSRDTLATGNIRFDLSVRSQAVESPLDCAAGGISTILALVYNSEGIPIAEGGPWPCERHQGLIENVPVGEGREVQILAFSPQNQLVQLGQKVGVGVRARTPNEAESIELIPFVPVLTTPADGATTSIAATTLRWQAITGNIQYHLIIDDDINFASPEVDETLSVTQYIPDTLVTDTIYYWRVSALASRGVESSFAETRSFEALTPTLTIDGPVDQSFTTCDTISFAANTFPPDTTLSWDWFSSSDGSIGSTSTFTSSNLTAGTHQITVTASNSQNAMQQSFEVNIVNASVSVTISTPTNGSHYQVGDSVSFNGTAVDALDNDILPTFFLWNSNRDQVLATGVNSFTSNDLSAGTHIITLTAVDSLCPDGTPGNASVTIDVVLPEDIDNDGDGFSETQGDCNDADASIHPGALEIPNDEIDQDCSGSDQIDLSAIDNDNDGYSENQGDCNDADVSIHPGAIEIPNDGIDQDCSGSDQIDLSAIDNDNDGYSENQGDCNDGDASIHPGAIDLPNDGIDQDCSGADSISITRVYYDMDADNYGNPNEWIDLVGGPNDIALDGVVFDSTDCNDADSSIHPGAIEIPNDGIDQNCDGSDFTPTGYLPYD